MHTIQPWPQAHSAPICASEASYEATHGSVQDICPVFCGENLVHAQEGVVSLRETDHLLVLQIATEELYGLDISKV